MTRLVRWFARTALYATTGRDMKAVTLFCRVWLLRSPGELMEMLGPEKYRQLHLHEQHHVKQQREESWRFYPRYFLEHVRRGYRLNRYEVEARRAAGEE